MAAFFLLNFVYYYERRSFLSQTSIHFSYTFTISGEIGDFF